MMSPHRDTLDKAREIYSKCANKVQESIDREGYTEVLSRKVIGIGIANEWVNRAAMMDSIDYRSKLLNNRKKSDLFLELIRFNFSWSALNAIYSREDLLFFFRPPSTNPLPNNSLPTNPRERESSKFELLYKNALLSNTTNTIVEIRLKRLRQLLDKSTETKLPIPNNPPVSTLKAIYLKYIPTYLPKRGGNAQYIEDAALAEKADTLTMPILLYEFRNWSVHGNALHGSFGSDVRFLEYASLLQETLADVHYATATKLMSLL